MAVKETYWIGALGGCQLCGNDFNGIMYDARVMHAWGNICEDCFERFDGQLGIGRGQKYEQREDGKYYLIEGNKE